MTSSRRGSIGIAGAFIYLVIVIIMLPAWAWAQPQGSPATEPSNTVPGSTGSGQPQGSPATEPSDTVPGSTGSGQPQGSPSTAMEFWKFPSGWLPFLGTAIMGLIQFLRFPVGRGLLTRFPRRVRILVPVGLSAIAAIIWAVLNGQGLLEALYFTLFASSTAVFAHEAVFEAILGREYPRGAAEPRPEVPAHPVP